MQKIQQHTFFTLLIISAGLNAYLFRQNTTHTQAIQALEQQYSFNILEGSESMDYYKQKDSMQFYSENRIVSPQIKLRNLNDQELELKDLVVTPKMILYWDQYNCSACYQSHFVDINGIMEKYGHENFAFLGRFESLRELSVFIKAEGIRCPAYLLDHDMLDLPLENGEMPFVFYMDASLKAANVFSLDKSLHQRNNDYMIYAAMMYFGE